MAIAVSAASQDPAWAIAGERTFQQDVEFLRGRVPTVVLSRESDPGGPRVAVVPAYQGRVMTSTAGGRAGSSSFGWINYAHIESGEKAPQINVYGGEERFWLGPEGGQFALFFPPGAEFEFSQWRTPSFIDTEAFEVTSCAAEHVAFRREAEVVNYSKTRFHLRVDRKVELLRAEDVAAQLAVDLPPLACVGYRTTNRLTNVGETAWTKTGGLPSIWILGMYKHGPRTVVVVPYVSGELAQLGPVVNDDYFGRVPRDRLRTSDVGVFFCADGASRGKIGLSPQRSRGVCGSFDAARNVLTVVKYNQPGPEVLDYVNSQWAVQESPYTGDAINAYNDGPASPGAKPLGPFYELETSSPALALKPGGHYEHVQETYHFEGERSQLDAIARRTFGVGVGEIDAAAQESSHAE